MRRFRVTATLERIVGSIEIEAEDENDARSMVDEGADFQTWIADDFIITQVEEL